MGNTKASSRAAKAGLFLLATALPVSGTAATGIEGCYFVPGAGGLLLLRETEGCGVAVHAVWPQTLYEWTAWKEQDGTIGLAYDFSEEVRSLVGATEDRYPPNYLLAPSDSVPGDWDLAAFRPRGCRPVAVRKMDGDTASQRLDHPLERLSFPVAGFLHRVPEQPWRSYFELREASSGAGRAGSGECAEARRIAEAILRGAPDDAAAIAVWLDAMSVCDDADAIESAIVDWGPVLIAQSNPGYGRHLHAAGIEAAGCRADASGRNARSVMDIVYGPGTDLDERLAACHDLLRFDESIPDKAGIFQLGVPSFLSHQVAGKVLHNESIFRMMRGDREGALELALANYRGAQLLDRGDSVIDILIGVAMRSIIASTLELWLANACETPEELEQFRKGTESLRDLWHERDAGEFAILMDVPAWSTEGADGTLVEATVRGRVANQRFELLRCAAAAKKYRMSGSAWPGSATTVNVLFPKDPPRDLFGGKWLLGGSRGDDFVAYSTGPDLIDDGGAVAYDPTNGTISGGDIFVELPAARKYPFPREGFHPERGDDVASTFPNGLPADIFADTRFRPLTARTGDATVIFSFGPDADQARYTHLSRPDDQPQYDPTNGTVSVGNLYYRP